MATETEAATSIATIVAQTPVVVLVDKQKCEQLYAHIQREIDAFEPDLTTQKGRDAIKSLAFKITRTKTAIDAAGKELNEEARAKINAVDAARRDAREKLDAMAKAVRQPLTDWEEAEAERVAWCNQVIADLKRGAMVTMDDTAETVRTRGHAAYNVIIKPETFGDLFDEAQAVKDQCVATLKSALDRLVKEEADRAELERLRAEAAAREAREQAEREVAEKKARAEAEAREAEQRRIAAEEAEAERIKRAAEQAEQRARDEAERIAKEAADKLQREHDEALAAERRRAEEAEAAIRAERERVEREEAARQAAAEAEAAEEKRRAEDRAHRGKIMGAAKSAMMTCGADEETAKKIVLAIIAGEVPAVSLRF
jgi:hypothetical protein